LFELADKGTIFFDEIGNIPLETQAKLLRVIQEREFMRLGGVENIKVDVRIIAATNVDLKKMMEDGRFREDLYYRLHVITVQLPPIVVPPEGISYRDAEAAFQRSLIESALEAAGGVQKRAAELLQIKPTTLNEMIKRHDIRPRRKKAGARSDEPEAQPEPVTAE